MSEFERELSTMSTHHVPFTQLENLNKMTSGITSNDIENTKCNALRQSDIFWISDSQYKRRSIRDCPVKCCHGHYCYYSSYSTFTVHNYPYWPQSWCSFCMHIKFNELCETTGVFVVKNFLCTSGKQRKFAFSRVIAPSPQHVCDIDVYMLLFSLGSKMAYYNTRENQGIGSSFESM